MQGNPRQFHAVDSGLYALGSGFLVSETWIPDANRKWDFGLQSLRFWISRAKLFSGTWNPDDLTRRDRW